MKTTFAAAAALLIAATAGSSAADLAFKAPHLSPVWNWTGFYVGGHVGAGWGTTESTLDSLVAPGAPAVAVGFPLAQNNQSGFLGGGQIGYNYQSGWAVFGVQGDIAGLSLKGTATCIFAGACTDKGDWLATATGRFGGVVTDKTLVYVKGGAAWLRSTHDIAIPGAGLGGGFAFGTTSAQTTSLGWLLGMGAEYAFSPNWSAFLEYNYMEFDTKTAAMDLSALAGGAAATGNVSYKNKLSIAKVGVNYKF